MKSFVPDKESRVETGPKDEALMARVAVGDKPAFRALVARHQASVYRLAFRHLGRVQDAEDLAQCCRRNGGT